MVRITGKLETMFWPGRPAKGRAKAKPWRIAVTREHFTVLEITGGACGPDLFEAVAMVDAMVADYNALHPLHLNDPQIAKGANNLRTSWNAPGALR